jgi:acetate---CoA ligase (ADP-forming)
MLEARSVAVVGASPRPGSFGQELMVQLVRGGFDGAIYPVNPNYREVLGFPCHPGIAELPEPVDLAILGVGNERLEEQLAAAAAAGAAAAVLFASCHEPPRQGVPPLAERLRHIAASAGMVLCGGNGMGFLNWSATCAPAATTSRWTWSPAGSPSSPTPARRSPHCSTTTAASPATWPSPAARS